MSNNTPLAPMSCTIARKQTPGAFNSRCQWKRGGMLWTITVSGSPNGRSDGDYAFNRKKDAMAAFDFATTAWDGKGHLPDMVHQWMWKTSHPLKSTYKGDF